MLTEKQYEKILNSKFVLNQFPDIITIFSGGYTARNKKSS